MRKLLLLAFFSFLSSFALAAENYSAVFKAQGKYEDVRVEDYARRIVIAYLSRYCKTWTDENVARIHNGGPSGHKKKSTIKYWREVRARLD